ncbi:GFA family protein [Vibrio rhizosphaerae]|uniref:GFA family protein n=1 Tax=Vibrio rhizosphaerae TaxID=398736 RepID=A0ABU4IZC9_9VIBR|nr:GFA family protein [Vibrio rhizosphaerae]MDW6094268.1 GFA family protein [Vibrio rhizosphaerae]
MHHFQGSCLCGSIRYEVAGKLQKFFLCHCQRCRKDTGSAHAANIFINPTTFDWLSGADLVKTYHHPDSRHVKSFCQNCGSAVPTIIDNTMILLPAGSLDSEPPRMPDANIFVDSQANWSKNTDNLPGFAQLPE